MNEPEIILNLWYVCDDMGMIYSLRVRAYVHSGSDEEKLAFLQRFAETDYLIARPFPIPEGFRTTISGGGTEAKMPILPMQALEAHGGAIGAGQLFNEAMTEIEKDFPAQTKLRIPEDPLMCLTPLYADNNGNIHPKIDGQVRTE